MSRQEMVDEHKESDGDPHMKGHRRQRGREIAMNQMLQDVSKADVMVVNPTHYAVALKWKRGRSLGADLRGQGGRRYRGPDPRKGGRGRYSHPPRPAHGSGHLCQRRGWRADPVRAFQGGRRRDPLCRGDAQEGKGRLQMNAREQLVRLQEVSQLMLDLRLLALEKAARARQASLDHLDQLNRPAPPTDLDPIVAGEVAMRYQNWADQRRSAINLELAQQTVEWSEARDNASLAFGRNAVIAKLRDRQDRGTG